MQQQQQHQLLDSQVGGHPGIFLDHSGRTIIKPLLPVELAFYQQLIADEQGGLSALKGLTPSFEGVLELPASAGPTAVIVTATGEPSIGSCSDRREGRASEPRATEAEKEDEAGAQPSPPSVSLPPTKHILLSNLTASFKYPSILDIKLGTVLYDAEASAEKRERMERRSRDTTSWETGVRLTGFQNWDALTGQCLKTPKAYGVALKPADLPSGIARFFPMALEGSLTPPESAQTEETVITVPTAVRVAAAHDVEAEASVDRDLNGPATTTSTAAASIAFGLPPSLLLPILTAVIAQTTEIKIAIERTEARFVGMSLLVVYEGCEKTLRRAFEGMDVNAGTSEARRPPATSVKLIDFAHSRPAPAGSGPDEGVLLGLRTVLSLLNARKAEVEQQQQ